LGKELVWASNKAAESKGKTHRHSIPIATGRKEGGLLKKKTHLWVQDLPQQKIRRKKVIHQFQSDCGLVTSNTTQKKIPLQKRYKYVEVATLPIEATRRKVTNNKLKSPCQSQDCGTNPDCLPLWMISLQHLQHPAAHSAPHGTHTDQ
jgi:hypothetical protein